MDYKFDRLLNQYKKLYEAPEAEPAAETPTEPSEETPQVDVTQGAPEQEVDIDAVMVQFTNLILDALEFGRKYGRLKNLEIDDILKNRPYSKDEAMAKLDILYQLLKSDIPPTTDYRGPGV